MRILFFTFYGCRGSIENLYNTISQFFDIDVVEFLSLKNEHKFSDENIIEEINRINVSKKNKINGIITFLLPENKKFFGLMKKELNNVPIVYYNEENDFFNNYFLEYSDNIDHVISCDIGAHFCINIFKNNISSHLVEKQSTENFNVENMGPYEGISIIFDTEKRVRIDKDTIIYEIKELCIDKNLQLSLFGSGDLENIYPDIYEGTLDEYSKKIQIRKITIMLNDIDDELLKYIFFLLNYPCYIGIVYSYNIKNYFLSQEKFNNSMFFLGENYIDTINKLYFVDKKENEVVNVYENNKILNLLKSIFQ
jgi:hypothetical protein